MFRFCGIYSFYNTKLKKQEKVELQKNINKKAKSIGKLFSELEDYELVIYKKGFDSHLQNMRNLVGFAEKIISKTSKAKKKPNSEEIQKLLAKQNISVIDQAAMLKGKQYKPEDFVINALIEDFNLEQSILNKEEINKQIDYCAQMFNNIEKAEKPDEMKKTIYELLNAIISIPEEDLKAYSATNVSFGQVVKCAYDIISGNKENIEKQKKLCGPGKTMDKIIGGLLLEYTGHHISQKHKESVEELLNTFSPTKTEDTESTLTQEEQKQLDSVTMDLVEELSKEAQTSQDKPKKRGRPPKVQQPVEQKPGKTEQKTEEELLTPEVLEEEPKKRKPKTIAEKKSEEINKVPKQRRVRKTKEEKPEKVLSQEEKIISNFYKYTLGTPKKGRPSKEDLALRTEKDAYLAENKKMYKDYTTWKRHNQLENIKKEKAMAQEQETNKALGIAKPELIPDKNEDILQHYKEKAKTIETPESIGTSSEFMNTIIAAVKKVDDAIPNKKDKTIIFSVEYKNGKIKLSNIASKVVIKDINIEPIDENEADQVFNRR